MICPHCGKDLPCEDAAARQENPSAENNSASDSAADAASIHSCDSFVEISRAADGEDQAGPVPEIVVAGVEGKTPKDEPLSEQKIEAAETKRGDEKLPEAEQEVRRSLNSASTACQWPHGP
jgi:hypothetical protein